MKTGFKKCPYCGKEIKDIAIKCQYCFKFLNQEPEKTTKECPFCLNEIDINEKECPFCDEILIKENKIKKLGKFIISKKIFFVVGILLIVLITLFLLIFKNKIGKVGDTADKLNKQPELQVPINGAIGDFNGDSMLETIGMNASMHTDENYDNTCYGQFSNNNIKTIKFDSCSSLEFINEGDINKDGKDDLGVIRYGGGCWARYYLYSYVNNEWTKLVEGEEYSCCETQDPLKFGFGCGGTDNLLRNFDGEVELCYNDMDSGEYCKPFYKAIKMQGKNKNNRDMVPQNQIPKDSVKGDFNGDGLLEDMRLEKIVDEIAMDGVCYIQFSDLSIPSIKVEGCIGGTPDNKLDINKNGTDEVGLMPMWYTSCRNAYFVRTYKNGGREYLVDPIPTHCNQQEGCQSKYNSDCNRIYSVGDNEVMIYYSELTDYGIEGKTKRVKIK